MSFHGRPRFRPAIELVPVKSQEGQQLIVFRDPEGLSGRQVAMSIRAGVVVHALLDGTRDRATFLHDWREAMQSDFPEPELDGLVRALEDAVLLEGPQVAHARRSALEQYRSLESRPAAFAGSSYPDDADALREQVARWREDSGVEPVAGPVRAVLAPHIDPTGGGACHGAAIAAFAASPAEVFVVLGTAHAGLQRPFALTTLDFDTPLGVVPTDRELVERLAARSGGGLLDDELAHRAEHSVEFQAVWLKAVHGDRAGLRIVPVLVGSQHGRILEGSSPREDPEVMDFVQALRELRAEYGERLAIVASVDFAHMGPRYDHPEAPDAAAMARVMEADRKLLADAEALDAEAWFQHLHEEQDERNVCGAAPIWTLLETLADEPLESRLLRHDAWEIDPTSGSQVTFAAVSWRSDGGDA